MTTSRPFVVALTWASAVAAESLRLQAEDGVPGETAFLQALETFRHLSAGPGPADAQPLRRGPKLGRRRGNPRPGNLRDRVLACLRESPDPLTPQELAEQCAAPSTNAVFTTRHALRSLRSDGLAEPMGWAEGPGRPRTLWRATPCQ